MKRWMPGKGYVDTVFEKGHQITDKEIRRSRGNRREALDRAQKLQQRGFERVSDMVPTNIHMKTEAFRVWPEDSLIFANTVYNPRGRYGIPQLDPEQWIKSPIEGIDPAAIIQVATLNFRSRPQYRRSWEVKLALEMTPDEIEVELMLHSFGDEDG